MLEIRLGKHFLCFSLNYPFVQWYRIPGLPTHRTVLDVFSNSIEHYESRLADAASTSQALTNQLQASWISSKEMAELNKQLTEQLDKEKELTCALGRVLNEVTMHSGLLDTKREDALAVVNNILSDWYYKKHENLLGIEFLDAVARFLVLHCSWPQEQYLTHVSKETVVRGMVEWRLEAQINRITLHFNPNDPGQVAHVYSALDQLIREVQRNLKSKVLELFRSAPSN